MPRRRIGVMGGTFDPVHLAHLMLAERAREHSRLAQVVWVPAGQPPHKPLAHPASPEDRFRMVELAIRGNPHFTLSRAEVDREGPSYAIDTLDRLQREFPDCELCLILGLDAALEIQTWHRHEELVARCRLLVGSRQGYPDASLREALPGPALGRMELFPCPQLEISATEIRGRRAAGITIRYMTPEPVQRYIESRALYREACATP